MITNFTESSFDAASNCFLSEHQNSRKLCSNDNNASKQLADLPSEIILKIFSYLPARDLMNLLTVSKGVAMVASSASLWAPFSIPSDRVPNGNLQDENYILRYVLLEAPISLQISGFDLEDVQDNALHTFPERDDEHAQHSRRSHSSFDKEISSNSYSIFSLDVLNYDRGLVVGTADDSTIRIWDVNRSKNISDFAVVDNHLKDCSSSDVRVQHQTGKLWVSANNILQEWDMGTFQKLSEISYDNTITTLSPDSQSNSVFISTPGFLHNIDTRVNIKSIEIASSPTALIPGYALSILPHSFRSPHSVSLSGRFPSIITYDLRNFSKALYSIYSGAHSLCSLLDLPKQEGIVASGEYNGRGTLEFYKSPNDDTMVISSNTFLNDDQSGYAYNDPRRTEDSSWVNRYTASRASLLCLHQPSWTDELVFAGSADGAIRCFDVSPGSDGTCYRELIDHNTTGYVSRILAISDRASVALVDGCIGLLNIGASADNEDDIEPADSKLTEKQREAIMRKEMDDHVRLVMRREIFGRDMLSLHNVLISL